MNIEDLIKNMGELKKLILKNNDKYFIISTTEENDKKIIENENIKIFNINAEKELQPSKTEVILVLCLDLPPDLLQVQYQKKKI